MTELNTLSVRFKSRLDSETVAVAIIVVVAAVARLYQLGTFPHFPSQAPWLGTNLSFPGLYVDEAARVSDVLRFPHAFPSYEPSIQIPFEKVSVILLGMTYFAYRLPNALASILTAVAVYFAGKRLFGSRGAALASGLYYAVMIPAVIYGRMVIYENFVAFFLALTILSIVEFERGGRARWLYFGAISSALATVSQEAGLFVLLFFTFWAATRKGWRSKIIPIIVSWVPVVAGGAAVLVLVGSIHGILHQWSFAQVGRELSFQFLFLQSLPSGDVIINQGYVKPEFWYIFAYLCIAGLVVAGARGGRLLVEILAMFMLTAVIFFGQGIGSYYIIMLFPVMALGVGGGISYVAKAGTSAALGLYAMLYAPLVLSYVASATLPFIGVNYVLYEAKVVAFATPLLGWIVLEVVSWFKLKRQFPFMVVLLMCFFGLLLFGTPQLYAYYFVGRAP